MNSKRKHGGLDTKYLDASKCDKAVSDAEEVPKELRALKSSRRNVCILTPPS